MSIRSKTLKSELTDLPFDQSTEKTGLRDSIGREPRAESTPYKTPGDDGVSLSIDTAGLLRERFFGETTEARSDLAKWTSISQYLATIDYEILEETSGPVADIFEDCGNDFLTNNGTMIGTGGDDELHGNDCDNIIVDHGPEHNWTVDHDTIFGHGGDDLISGGLGNDTFDGGDGNDALYGGFGDDDLTGGQGFDDLFGGGGNDTLRDADNANMHGNDGNDILLGGDGPQWMYGDAHDDYLEGGAGNDRMWGDDYPGTAPGNDTMLGGEGNDMLDGHMGDDFLDGGNGDDSVYGGPGDDLLYGGAGNDLITDDWANPAHAPGNDIIDAGAGDDLILGLYGANVMTGGSGADYFLFTEDTSVPKHANLSVNTVTDYSAAEGDVVQGFSASQVGTSTHVFSAQNELLFILLSNDMTADGLTMIW